MPRTSLAVPRHRRKKRLMKQAKGYFGSRSKTLRSARETVIRAGDYARAGRRLRKRDFRSLWITRLSAACMGHGLTYSRLIAALKAANITLNRKMLSELAVHDPLAFEAVVAKAKQAVSSRDNATSVT